MYGYWKDEVIGQPNTVMSADPDATRAATQEFKGYIPIRYHKRKDGSIFPIEITANVISVQGRDVIIAAVRDITERKMGEEALKNEKQRLANIIEGTRAGTWEWNVQTGETIFNEQWAEIIGYTLSEISPVSIKTWMNYAHPYDLQKSGELLERHFLQKSEWYECESRMKHKKGDWVWVLDRGKVASWTKDGKPLWMYGTHQDITERKQAEENLVAALKRTQSQQAALGEISFSPLLFSGRRARTISLAYGSVVRSAWCGTGECLVV